MTQQSSQSILMRRHIPLYPEAVHTAPGRQLERMPGGDFDELFENIETPEEQGTMCGKKSQRRFETLRSHIQTTLTTKTIDGREYYYLKWWEDGSLKSQYVATIDSRLGQHGSRRRPTG